MCYLDRTAAQARVRSVRNAVRKPLSTTMPVGSMIATQRVAPARYRRMVGDIIPVGITRSHPILGEGHSWFGVRARGPVCKCQTRRIPPPRQGRQPLLPPRVVIGNLPKHAAFDHRPALPRPVQVGFTNSRYLRPRQCRGRFVTGSAAAAGLLRAAPTRPV